MRRVYLIALLLATTMLGCGDAASSRADRRLDSADERFDSLEARVERLERLAEVTPGYDTTRTNTGDAPVPPRGH